MRSFGTWLRVVLVVFAVVSASSAARAEVKKLGEWPDGDRTVSLEVDGISRSQAVKALADQAGWSVVLYVSPSETIDLKVADQPADKVLELLLADGVYEATRTGNLISIKRVDGGAAAAAPSVPAAPAAPPPPPARPKTRGSDRVISGNSLRIEKDEVVNDVSVLGGSADVFGTVTGDLAVMGGSARVHAGGHVMGDASTVGGSLTIDDGARVDGDVGAVGGDVRRGPKAVVGGELSEVGARDPRGGDRADEGADPAEREGNVTRLFRDAGGAVTRTALLFVVGAVLLALGARRMEMLKVEVASRPMRSFAMGIVGSIGAALLFVVLCVTVIGIPFAVVGLVLALFAVVAAMCSVLETIGAALVGHRSANGYVHLAVGCALFLVAGALPFVGGFFKAAVVLIGIGTLVSTRGAGFLRRKNGGPPGSHPYRDSGA